MKTTKSEAHKHEFKTGRSKKVETCSCGKFRHVIDETNPAIVEVKSEAVCPDQRSELSFDGFGINGPDEYRTRLATFQLTPGFELERAEWAKKYGPMMAAAPEMLAALKVARNIIAYKMVHQPEDPAPRQREQIHKLNEVIRKAEGGK